MNILAFANNQTSYDSIIMFFSSQCYTAQTEKGWAEKLNAKENSGM